MEVVLVPVAEVSSRENMMDSWRTQKPAIDYSTCIRCMICWKFCPDNAIMYSDGRGYQFPNERLSKLEAPVIDYEHCKGCGICANECPEGSITMEMEGGE